MPEIKKTAGIICEYNTFHNGHKYQIETTKKAAGCEYIVCAMSGSMVQRGDAAIYDKWTRCRAAIEGGADLVVELPAYYVLQSAQNFALGGVELLSKLGVVDILSFGSETGNIELLSKIADIIYDEPPEFRSEIEAALAKGSGYPAAFQAALSAAGGMTLEPNDILAVNYLSAIKKNGAKLTPFALKRTVPYHAEIASDGLNASATAIRSMIQSGKEISSYIPAEYTADTYDIKNIESLILGFFRLCNPQKLKDIIGMEDGLENRLISCARKAASLEEFIETAVTKRYTYHRIRRVMFSCIMGITPGKHMDYVRVLGFNSKGRKLLSEIKAKSDLTIITKTAGFSPTADSMFEYDIKTTDIASLCCSNKSKRKAGIDYITSPVII